MVEVGKYILTYETIISSQIYLKSRGSNERENSWIFVTIGYNIHGITIGLLMEFNNRSSLELSFKLLASLNGEKWGEMKKFDWPDLSCSWSPIERKAEKRNPLWSGPSPAKLGSSPTWLSQQTRMQTNKRHCQKYHKRDNVKQSRIGNDKNLGSHLQDFKSLKTLEVRIQCMPPSP